MRFDLLAGLSVAAVEVPTAMAYAELAGFPPVFGIYSSILPLVAYACLGSSRQMIVDPDAATCTIVAAALSSACRRRPGAIPCVVDGPRLDCSRWVRKGTGGWEQVTHEHSIRLETPPTSSGQQLR